MVTGRRADRLSAAVRGTLHGLARLGADLDDPAFFAEVAAKVAEAVGAEKATVSVLESEMLRTLGSHGFAASVTGKVDVPVDPDGDGLAERILFGDLVFVGDLTREASLGRYREIIEKLGVRNAMAVAWRTGGAMVGTLSAFDSRRPGGFDADDVLVLELAADVTGFVMRERVHAARLQALLSLSDELSRLPDFAAMAAATAAAVRKIFPGIECGIVEVPRGRPDLFRTLTSPPGVEGSIPGESASAGTGSATVLESGEAMETDDLERSSVHGAALVAAGFRRVRVLPVSPGGPLPDGRASLGTIAFLSRSRRPFAADDRALMDDIGRRLGVVAHRAELMRLEAEESAGLRAALDAAIDIGSSLEPPAVIARLLKRATEVLAADRATLASIDGDDLVIQGSHAADGNAFDAGRRFKYATSPQFMRLMETRQPMRATYPLDEVEADARAAMIGFQHAITVPIVEDDRVVATLTVSRRADRPFGPSDSRTLEVVSAAAGIALQNARLYQETARGRLSMQIALEAAEDVASAVDLDDVIDKLLRRACAAAGAPYAVIGHLDEGELVVDKATHGRGEGFRWPLVDAVRDAIAHGRPAQLANPRSHAPTREHAEAIVAAEWALTVPLVLEGETVGVIGLGRPGSAFTDEEVDSVRRLAPAAALLVRNARLLEEARQASRVKTEFLNMAGHELRTPLAVIRGYISLLATGAYGDPPDGWSQVLSLVDDKGAELSSMVESILAAARLQSGRLQVGRDDVDLVELTRQAVDRARAAAALSGGAVIGRYPSEPVHVLGDPTQLAVIVDNLLANAVKYSPPPAAVTTTVEARGGYAEIRVADNGRGIPREHHARIFEEFERVDDMASEFTPGTGLGLYIARQLAARYGGTLELEWSEPGRGSSFLLRLPTTAS